MELPASATDSASGVPLAAAGSDVGVSPVGGSERRAELGSRRRGTRGARCPPVPAADDQCGAEIPSVRWQEADRPRRFHLGGGSTESGFPWSGRFR